jgi:GT2 family glycosyltransferase
MLDEPSVSVIVPTYEREQVLCETLKQLRNQTYENFDVHVVDHTETHTDDTLDFLSSLPERFSHHTLQEGGLTYARNYGINTSNGTIVLFVDDDVDISGDFVEAHSTSYNRSEIGAVAGQVLSPRYDTPTDDPPVGYTTWYGRSVMRLHSNQSGIVNQGRGCNMSFRRKPLEKIGGFDNTLSFRDETDVFLRLRENGFNVYFNPEASVFHHEINEGGTIFASQKSKQELKKVTRDKAYFHLKNKPLITFPASVLSSLLFRVKQRRNQAHKLPGDILVMSSGITSAIRDWRSRVGHRGTNAVRVSDDR